MKKYPQLTEMGVLHPEHIVRFAVNSLSNVDYLIITYRRPTGSFLPVSRTYEFPRIQRTFKATEDGEKDYDVLETSPVLKAAVEELESIVERRSNKEEIVKAMHNELRYLEEEFALRTAALRSMLDEVKGK